MIDFNKVIDLESLMIIIMTTFIKGGYSTYVKYYHCLLEPWGKDC